MSERQERRIVVVVGMHRSGTSAIARALQALGVDLGDRLMPPLPGVNDKGFLEDEDIVQLNVGLLRELGHDWHTLTPIRAQDLSGPAVAGLRMRAVDLLRERLGQWPVFGLKDPRMALLLPFWRSVFRHLDARVSFVICSRNPLSVARSLKARDAFDDEKSFFLWLQHVVPCFVETEGSARVVVDYDLMIDNPEMQLERISQALSLPFDRHGESLHEYAARFLEQGLRHTRYEAKDLGLVSTLPREVADAFDLMTRLARDELPVDSERVHALMLQWAEVLDRMSPAWGYMARCETRIADLTEGSIERDRQLAALNQGLSDLAAQIPVLNQTLSERNGQISALNQVLAERNEQVFIFNQWLAVRDERITALNRDLVVRDERNLALNNDLAARNKSIAILNQGLLERDERIAVLENQVSVLEHVIAGAEAQRDAAEAQRDALLASTSWRVTMPLRAIRKLLGGANTGDETFSREAVQLHAAPIAVSAALPATPFRYNLDQVIVDAQALMAFGWVFHKQSVIRSLSLKVTRAGREQVIPATYGKARDDVLASFQDMPQARFSGFMVLTAWAGDAIDGIGLTGRLEDGSVFDIPLHASSINKIGTGHVDASGAILRQWLAFAKRALILAGRGRFDLLFAKTRKFFDSRIHGATARSADDIGRMIGSQTGRETVLVIDHAMGGGANKYREEFVAGKLDEGKQVVLLSYQIASLSLALTLLGRDSGKSVRIPDVDLVVDLMDSLALKEIFYNDAVSFVQPQQVPELLVNLKARHPDALLTMAVHDYYAICPSPFLLNDHGVYCGVPDLDVCRKCLRANHQPFMSLFPARDITQWRTLWGAALQAADRIVAFSHSSVAIMRKAYPGIEPGKFVVRPHTIDGRRFPAIMPDQTETLHIGVLGHIGQHKGADIVSRLADEIARRGESIRITVIGTLEAAYSKEVITETGPYRPEELPDLIRQSGANVFLFPSVCPETFSFVVGELIQMTLPVACFDIGAPAERVKAYAKGKVMDFMDAGRLVEELIDFHMSTYLLGEVYE